MAKGWITLGFFFMALPLSGQVAGPGDPILLDTRKEILRQVEGESAAYHLTDTEKERLSRLYHFPLTITLDENRVARFQYMDGNGSPVYYTTFNLNAARTTGASSLQAGGDLDLGLDGNGMVVGIYDQTRPKANHREFGNRVTQIDGSTEELSNHATHVTGTILATGINANARGMATATTGWAFNWDGDISKMAQNGYDPELRPEGHLISNHSYGNLVGWYRDTNGNWAWAGNEAINNREDYRFGFYTSKSRQIDELAFSKPYYTVVWAAGNDRSDVGDGTRNTDGPEDSIGPEGVAKNNITVGAVSGVPNYTGPEDVVMSPFSSWGPVDDGRIKPDFVAMGVNVFSTAIANEGQADSYTTMSGTSMAAPNASGSLLLLQELYHERNGGRYMRAATLKGLGIHTAREAGPAPGPDYMFGWGLLDVKATAEMIINENGTSNIVSELVLHNNETYEFDFISDGISPIKLTISWTDPAGVSPAPAVDPEDLMLVNDLDVRIIDEDGAVYFPWSLDPRLGTAARAINTGDNFRDNVEQILINAPESKRFTVRVTHKGTLKNNLQAFSLIFDAGVADGQEKTLYWIGGEGSWHSPQNWSLESNGPSAGMIPDGGTRVVFDQGGVNPPQITLSEDAEVFSLNFFGNTTTNIDLNSRNLVINNGFRVSNQVTAIQNGKLTFQSDRNSQNIVDFGSATWEDVEMAFDGGMWRVISAELLDQVAVSNAELELDIPAVQLTEFDLGEGGKLGGRIEDMIFTQTIRMRENSDLDASVKFRFIGESGSFADFAKNEIPALISDGTRLELQEAGKLTLLDLRKGELQLIKESITVGSLNMQQGVILNLMDNHEINVLENISHQQGIGQPSVITADSKGVFRHEFYKKYCFQNIQIRNVDLLGESVINLGSGAVVTNSANWETLSCDQVLFANFQASFTCEGSLVEFSNTTEGPATGFEWNFGDLGTSTERNPTFIFPREGSFRITLSAMAAGRTMVYEKDIVVGGNILEEPSIVVNGSMLTSLVPAGKYQWYRNGVKIEGAENRSFWAEDQGTYQVAILNESCNRISDAVVISSLIEEPPMATLGYFIGPNPTDGNLNIRINNSYVGSVEFSIYSTSGVLVMNYQTQKNQVEFERDLQLNIQPGLYVLLIRTGDRVLHDKVIVK